MNKENNNKGDWEIEFDELMATFNINKVQPTENEIVIESSVKKFISNLLQQQREELVEKIDKLPTLATYLGVELIDKKSVKSLIKGD